MLYDKLQTGGVGIWVLGIVLPTYGTYPNIYDRFP